MRIPVVSRIFALLCTLLLCVGVNFAQAVSAEEAAQETAAMKAEMDGQIQALLNAPPGVFDVEYEDGQLVRLKIKGESEVSTALQGVRADRQARDSANRDARAAFSRFLNDQVTVVETGSEGFVIQQKDGKESAEFLNASQRTVASLSSSFLRGLIPLIDHVEGEGVNRKAVVVLGWSKKLVEASADAQTTMNQSRANESGTQATQPAPAAGGGAPTGTQTRSGNLRGF